MKIEKVNDHQIRCTLTKADLADRELKISELAYGTEKAKNLFRDMMQQASFEFGFEAEDIPLMIEAIPLSGDCIVLIITKVEDPEELDTRFSKFAPSVHDNESVNDVEDVVNTISQGADDVLDLFKKIRNEKEKLSSSEKAKNGLENNSSESEIELTVPVNLTKLYSFINLDDCIRLAHVLKDYYMGENTLYRHNTDKKFYLVLRKSNHSPEEFHKVCNIISEYARTDKYSDAIEAYLEEHANTIIKNSALQSLTQI